MQLPASFLAEAAEEKLRGIRLADSARKAAGSLVGKPTPSDWESLEGAAEWVRASRAADADRFKHLLDRE